MVPPDVAEEVNDLGSGETTFWGSEKKIKLIVIIYCEHSKL
jgi:hypothetical protein